jgi:hypothetical protein
VGPSGPLLRLPLLLLCCCQSGACSGCKKGSPRLDLAPGARAVEAGAPAEAAGRARWGWTLAREERFEGTDLGRPAWSPDPVPDDGPFADGGLYFRKRGISPPPAYRVTQSFGQSGWLTVEAYSRSSATPYASLVSVVADPDRPENRVLRLASPRNTDAVVVRSSLPLPESYRISLRVGHASFGDGKPGPNGYDGAELAEPWLEQPATTENGFYWLAILDALPRPHNNLWIHHHRKLAIDSDNHYPPWMEIWNGTSFIPSGERPVMLFAVDGRGKGSETAGKPFLSYSAGSWQPSGKIRALDRYRSATWYWLRLTRRGDRFSVELRGEFELGGHQTYGAEIDAAARCVFHYNRAPLPAGSPCVDLGHYPELDPTFPHWPPDQGWPDYFVFGDPHSNFYEGEVYYDDLRLELWQP